MMSPTQYNRNYGIRIMLPSFTLVEIQKMEEENFLNELSYEKHSIRWENAKHRVQIW